jgi:O-6-methylguanine DNA methyltransferase
MSSQTKKVYYNTFSSDAAAFYIAGYEGKVTDIGLSKEFYPVYWVFDPNSFREELNKINEFFEGTRKSFDIPFELEGTDFQKKVWETISKIPYGETRSYKEVAIMTQNPNAARAVGNVCNKNRLFLVVPCHRVVASNSIGGYGGNLDAKRWLLNLENENK